MQENFDAVVIDGRLNDAMACIRSYHALDLTDKNIQRWEENQCLKSSNRKYNNANRRREPNGQNN